MGFSIPELVFDVLEYIKAREQWQKYSKWSKLTLGIYGSYEKKTKIYGNYIKKMKRLEKKFNKNYFEKIKNLQTNQIENGSIYNTNYRENYQELSKMMPSAPSLDQLPIEESNIPVVFPVNQ